MGVGGCAWHHILWGDAPSISTSKEPFWACVVSPLPQGWKVYDLLILYSNWVLSLSVLAIAVTIPRRQSLAIDPVSIAVFYFKVHTGG